MTGEGEAPKRAVGADGVETGPAGELFLVCPSPKSWTPRKERTLTSAEFPGTAVDWAGSLFEVRRAEHLPGGGVRYSLAPWAEGHAIRRIEHYDEAAEQARETEWSDRAESVRNRRLSILLAPLAGLLPGETQKEMEREFGAPSIAMTISSALPLFVIGFIGLFERFLGGLGGGLGFPGWLAPPFPIALYLFAESALRLASAVAAGAPMGSLPVVIAYQAWREARAPQAAAEGDADAPPERRLADSEHRGADRFQMLEPLLSLLSPPEQKALAERFPFDAIRWGRVTTAVLLLVGGGNVVASVLNFSAGLGGVKDAVWLLVGGFLCVEQIRRRKRLSAGEPAGSVLGALVRPLTKPLFATASGSARPDAP